MSDKGLVSILAAAMLASSAVCPAEVLPAIGAGQGIDRPAVTDDEIATGLLSPAPPHVLSDDPNRRLAATGLSVAPNVPDHALATTGVYDESDRQRNAVSFSAAGNNISLAEFGAAVAKARREHVGGVVHFDDFGEDRDAQRLAAARLPGNRRLIYGFPTAGPLAVDFGNDVGITITDPQADSRLAIGHFDSDQGRTSDRLAISAGPRLANMLLKAPASHGGGASDYRFAVAPEDKVTHVAFTLLPHYRSAYTADVTITLSDGTTYVFATETIGGSGAGGGTFFAYRAPDGKHIVLIAIDLPETLQGGLDDLGLITALETGRSGLISDTIHGDELGHGGIGGGGSDPAGGGGQTVAGPVPDGGPTALGPSGGGGGGGEGDPPAQDLPPRDGTEEVPEPATVALLGLGALPALARRRRRITQTGSPRP